MYRRTWVILCPDLADHIHEIFKTHVIRQTGLPTGSLCVVREWGKDVDQMVFALALAEEAIRVFGRERTGTNALLIHNRMISAMSGLVNTCVCQIQHKS